MGCSLLCEVAGEVFSLKWARRECRLLLDVVIVGRPAGSNCNRRHFSVHACTYSMCTRRCLSSYLGGCTLMGAKAGMDIHRDKRHVIVGLLLNKPKTLNWISGVWNTSSTHHTHTHT